METFPVTPGPLNVDITKFMGEEDTDSSTALKLRKELQSNEHVILKMLEEGRDADIILTAQGGSVKAHRFVLSVASPVFKAMFEHDMKEKLSSTVHIPDMTIEGLQLILLVLYTANDYVSMKQYNFIRPILPLFSMGIDKHFDEFFKGLSMYQVFRRRIEPLLKDALKRKLTPENCWEYYDISLQFSEESCSCEEGCSCVQESCSYIIHQYILKNFYEVVQSANFLLEMKRDADRVYSILVEAGRESHLLIQALKALHTEKCGQPSTKRRRAS